MSQKKIILDAQGKEVDVAPAMQFVTKKPAPRPIVPFAVNNKAGQARKPSKPLMMLLAGLGSSLASDEDRMYLTTLFLLKMFDRPGFELLLDVDDENEYFQIIGGVAQYFGDDLSALATPIIDGDAKEAAAPNRAARRAR